MYQSRSLVLLGRGRRNRLGSEMFYGLSLVRSIVENTVTVPAFIRMWRYRIHTNCVKKITGVDCVMFVTEDSMKRRSISISEYFDSLLLALARVYESDSLKSIDVERTALVGRETLESYLAGLCSVDWLQDCDGFGYRLTTAGYRQFKPRIRELLDRRQRELRKEVLAKVHRQKLGYSGTHSHPDTRNWQT